MGKRGPKPSGCRRRCVYITDEDARLLREWGRGDVSAGLRWLVRVMAPFIRRRGHSNK